MCGELQLPPGDFLLVLPLSMRDEVRGHLVICSRGVASPELLDSLEGLATQISLALEAASLTEDLHRRQSEARFRSLVAHSSDLITVLDGDGIVTYQSPSIERVLGYSVEEIEGTQFDRLLLDADRHGPLAGDHGRRSRGLRGARDQLLVAASRRYVAPVRDPARGPARRRARARESS